MSGTVNEILTLQHGSRNSVATRRDRWASVIQLDAGTSPAPTNRWWGAGDAVDVLRNAEQPRINPYLLAEDPHLPPPGLASRNGVPVSASRPNRGAGAQRSP
jgi:hypothetical protein